MQNIPIEVDIELLQPGDKAPDFSLPSHEGETITLSDYRGQWCLVWWYVQAMGVGCRTCARAFMEQSQRLRRMNANLFGISYASPEQNKIFAENTRFIAPLLTADEELAEQYGAKRSDHEEWSMLPRRIAYIIDPDGVVRERYVITRASDVMVPEIVDDLEAYFEAGLQEPSWGKQPHEMTALGRMFYKIRRKVETALSS